MSLREICSPLFDVLITLYFCKARKPEVCIRLDRTSDNFAIKVYSFDISKYSSFDDIVNVIIDDIYKSYLRWIKDEVKATNYINKVRPYIEEVVFDALYRYFEMLQNIVEDCERYGNVLREDYETEIETKYPSLFARLEWKLPADVCECVPEILAVLSKYEEVRTVLGMGRRAYVAYKMGRVSPEARAVIESVLKDTPLEEVLRKFGLIRWCYEVYYHA